MNKSKKTTTKGGNSTKDHKNRYSDGSQDDSGSRHSSDGGRSESSYDSEDRSNYRETYN